MSRTNMTTANSVRADEIARHTAVGGRLYLNELVRRETARTAEKLVELIQQMRWLTVAIAGATIVALAISVVALLRS